MTTRKQKRSDWTLDLTKKIMKKERPITESEIYSLITPMANRQEMKVEDFLIDIVRCFTKENTIAINDIMTIVSDVFQVQEYLITGINRDQHITQARQMFCFLANRYTTASLTVIGARVNKDHTAASYMTKKLNEDLINNPYLKELKSKCVRRLINGDR